MTSRDQSFLMLLRPFSILLLGAVALPVSSGNVRAQMPCANDFMPLREAVDRDGAAVKALADKRAPREAICTQIKKFAVTEAKYVKYLTDNQSWCGIPPDAVKQVSTSHQRTLALRTQVCNGGAGPVQRPQGPPPGPGLSEALGTSQSYTPPASPQARRGTYDTLTGNPFER